MPGRRNRRFALSDPITEVLRLRRVGAGRHGNRIDRWTLQWFRSYNEGDPEPHQGYVRLACEVEKALLTPERKRPTQLRLRHGGAGAVQGAP